MDNKEKQPFIIRTCDGSLMQSFHGSRDEAEELKRRIENNTGMECILL